MTPDQTRIAALEARIAVLEASNAELVAKHDGWHAITLRERDRMAALVYGRFMRMLETAYAAITAPSPALDVVEERIDECLKLMRTERERLESLKTK